MTHRSIDPNCLVGVGSGDTPTRPAGTTSTTGSPLDHETVRPRSVKGSDFLYIGAPRTKGWTLRTCVRAPPSSRRSQIVCDRSAPLCQEGGVRVGSFGCVVVAGSTT